MRSRACCSLLSVVLALQCLACAKRADTSPPSQPARPKPYNGQTYRSKDGRVITMISPDELELTENGVNHVCKYTQQDGVLRVVINALGATQAVYYRVTPDGLTDPTERRFYSKAGLLNATRAEMCAIGTAFYSHRIDFHSYYLIDSMHSTEQRHIPLDDQTDGTRSGDLVSKALSPLYMHAFPQSDAWGNLYEFAIRDHGNLCVIASPGADRKPAGGDDFVLEVDANGQRRFISIPKGLPNNCQ